MMLVLGKKSMTKSDNIKKQELLADIQGSTVKTMVCRSHVWM